MFMANIYKNKLSRSFKKHFFLPGRITWTKNIELAISSFIIFSKTNSDFTLVIAGQLDAKNKDYYSKLFEEKHNNIVVNVNPTDKSMSKLYQNCYAVLCPALNEDWGITPIEANSYGKPTICVNSGGFKESQINNVTGYLVEPTPESFSKAMTKLVNNRKLTLELGGNAFKNSLKYDWKIFVNKFEALLDTLITVDR